MTPASHTQRKEYVRAVRKGEIVIPAEKAQALAGMRSATTKKLVEASPHCASETSLSFQRSAGRWAWERQSCILSSPSFRRSERRGRRRPLLGDRRLGLLCRPHRPAHRQRRRQRTRRCDRQLCFCSVRRASIPHFVASTESLRPPPPQRPAAMAACLSLALPLPRGFSPE